MQMQTIRAFQGDPDLSVGERIGLKDDLVILRESQNGLDEADVKNGLCDN